MRSIDNPKYLANSKVYIFAGSLDSVVVPGMLFIFYSYYLYLFLNVYIYISLCVILI